MCAGSGLCTKAWLPRVMSTPSFASFIFTIILLFPKSRGWKAEKGNAHNCLITFASLWSCWLQTSVGKSQRFVFAVSVWQLNHKESKLLIACDILFFFFFVARICVCVCVCVFDFLSCPRTRPHYVLLCVQPSRSPPLFSACLCRQLPLLFPSG